MYEWRRISDNTFWVLWTTETHWGHVTADSAASKRRQQHRDDESQDCEYQLHNHDPLQIKIMRGEKIKGLGKRAPAVDPAGSPL